MQKEECGRPVRSTVMLIVAGSSYATAGTDEDPEYLWIKEPANMSVSSPSLRSMGIVCYADEAGLVVR